MINYSETRVGDKLKITGMGATGYAELGDTVTVEDIQPHRVDVVNERGEKCFFALTCGAQRLEKIQQK